MLPRRSRPEWDKVASSRIREERARLGLSQEAFAAALGVDRKTVGRWERGEASPSAAQLATMVDLGADVRYVLVGKRERLAVSEPLPTWPADGLTERLATLTRAQRAALSALIEAFS